MLIQVEKLREISQRLAIELFGYVMFTLDFKNLTRYTNLKFFIIGFRVSSSFTGIVLEIVILLLFH